MTYIWLGILLFGGPHVFGILFPSARDSFRARMGEGPYKGLYSLVSLVGIGLFAAGYLSEKWSDAGSSTLYDPAPWARHATMLLAWIGFVLIGASHGKGYLKSWVRHPMSLGVGLWAIGHLLANGETAVVLIFATLLAVAVLDIVFSLARGKGPVHQPVFSSDIKALVIGTIVYLVLVFGFHPYVLGVPVTG